MSKAAILQIALALYSLDLVSEVFSHLNSAGCGWTKDIAFALAEHSEGQVGCRLRQWARTQWTPDRATGLVQPQS